MTDPSNGYEAAAERFIALRSQSLVGVRTVREWTRYLPAGATVLDLGCGDGVPISQALIENRCIVYGIDSSPSMTAAFEERFPQSRVVCEPVEDSDFFARRFDAVIAWGLMFLLPSNAQQALIKQVSGVLNPGGRFLFTAPKEACTWDDALTGSASLSLGSAVYERTLLAARLTLVGQYDDEGDNHYFNVQRP